MSKTHPTAISGFQNQTSAYAKARPSYPQESINHIASHFSEPLSSKKVIDLGAGTGIMTKLLYNAGFDVTAVEPVEGMRTKLQELLPEVTTLEGTSWSIPVESSSQDAVVLAQCFHWFSDEKSLQELHRVLKPNGFIFLIWNMESRERADWVARLRDEYEVYETSAPVYRNSNWKIPFDSDLIKSLFNLPLNHTRFNNDFFSVRSNIWSRIVSKSYIAILDTSEQEKLHQKIEKILVDQDFPLDDTKPFIYPHDTDLYWCQKK